jgi:hypothetical protein
VAEIISRPIPIYRSDGKWAAVLYEGNLFDTHGEWVAWLDGSDVYSLEGEYIGYISKDRRLLRQRVLPYVKRRRPPSEHPPFRPLQTAPLAPMFAELNYSTVDVFEETPDIFALVHELRPDAGERGLLRLVEVDPRLEVEKNLRRVEQDLMEQMTYGLVYSYRVIAPPVPVEAMIAGLRPEMAATVPTAKPEERLQLADRLITRLGLSKWALEREYCGPDGFSPAQVGFAARALLMPRHWIHKDPPSPVDLARRYVVPVGAVLLRLHDLE